MNRWSYLLFGLLIFILPLTSVSDLQAQAPAGQQAVPSEPGASTDHHSHPGGRWEGSPEGIAFSEFNHHFAGVRDMLFGFAELSVALEHPMSVWTCPASHPRCSWCL